jgi:hypothetical protein
VTFFFSQQISINHQPPTKQLVPTSQDSQANAHLMLALKTNDESFLGLQDC